MKSAALLLVLALMSACRTDGATEGESSAKNIISDTASAPRVTWVENVKFDANWEKTLSAFGYRSGANCLQRVQYLWADGSVENRDHFLRAPCNESLMDGGAAVKLFDRTNSKPVVLKPGFAQPSYVENFYLRVDYAAWKNTLPDAQSDRVMYPCALAVFNMGALAQLCTGEAAGDCDAHINSAGAIDELRISTNCSTDISEN